MAMDPKNWARRAGRLFVIRTRWEAWAVTWAIALGAAERGKYYLALYPGALGWTFFVVCCGVVFVAGAKLLDATRREDKVVTSPGAPALASAPMRRLRPLSRNRPRAFRPLDGSRLRSAHRRD